MTQILLLHSSFAPAGMSASRRLSEQLLQHWLERDPKATVVARDLAENPLPHATLDLIAGSAMPAGQRTQAQSKAVALSDKLIEELLRANVIIIGMPMYNFSIPSTLKAWIDHIAIAGKTFAYNQQGRPEGMIHGKRLYIVASRGGIYGAGPMESFNFQEPYILKALHFLGLTEATLIVAERQRMGFDQQKIGEEAAVAAIADAITAAFPA